MPLKNFTVCDRNMLVMPFVPLLSVTQLIEKNMQYIYDLRSANLHIK